MSSAAGSDDGDDEIVADLMRDFPAPLNQLLVELAEEDPGVDAEEIVSDTSVEDLFGGDLR